MLLRVILLGILFTLIARAFWRLVETVVEGAKGRPTRIRPAQKLVRDPACGTYIVPEGSLSVTAGGRIHHFCSEACRASYAAR
jgi:YHS domain-containing protein